LFPLEIPSLDSVARFGEFSPIGRLFTFGNLLKFFSSSQILGATLFHGERCVVILSKNGFGCYLAGLPDVSFQTKNPNLGKF
jgi:hypothetical protein